MTAKSRFLAFSLASLLAVAPFGLPAPAAFAEDPSDEVLLQAEKSRQKQRAAAQEFVAGLDLNERQTRRLLPLLDESAVLRIAFYDEHARLLPEMIEAFRSFAREDSLNQGFSPPVERRTARANHQAKQAREAIVAKLIDLERRATDILSDSQCEYALTFKPGRPAGARAARRDAGMRRPGARRRPDRRNPARRTADRPRHRGTGNDRLAAARRELAAISRQIHPRLGPVGQWLLHPTAVEDLCRITGTRPTQNMQDAVRVFEHGTKACRAATSERRKADVNRLRGEINNWNLINGLHLCRHQIEGIAAIYDGFAAERKAGRDRVPPRVKLVQAERAIEQVMNPGQRQVLSDYKACLIPPKNLKNPVRVGQANDSSRYERWLDKVRTRPARARQKIVEAQLDREAEHFGELEPPERRARVNLLLAAIREAAEMSDTEFELDKAQLAERIAPRDRVKELQAEIGSLAREEGQPGKIAQFILKPKFIEQLRIRGRQLAAGAGTEEADLAAGPQAGNCENGCAVKPKGRKGRRS